MHLDQVFPTFPNICILNISPAPMQASPGNAVSQMLHSKYRLDFPNRLPQTTPDRQGCPRAYQLPSGSVICSLCKRGTSDPQSVAVSQIAIWGFLADFPCGTES